MYYIYLIETLIPTHFYIGQTSNIAKRIFQHSARTSTNFTKEYGVKYWKVLSIVSTRTEAVRLEREFRDRFQMEFPNNYYSIGKISANEYLGPRGLPEWVKPEFINLIVNDTSLDTWMKKAEVLSELTGKHVEASKSFLRRLLV